MSAYPVIAKFHRTDTDTDLLADFRARILARKSPCPARAEVGLPRRSRSVQLADLSAQLLSDARFSSRGCPLGMRAFTRVRVLYMINYRVDVYKITR